MYLKGAGKSCNESSLLKELQTTFCHKILNFKTGLIVVKNLISW